MADGGHNPDREHDSPAGEAPPGAFGRVYGTNEFGRLNDALRDWDDAGSDVGGAAASVAAAVAAPSLAGPRQVGRYRVIESIGEGGMGAVYKAEQTHPVRRTVAVKLVKPGLDSREVLARFDAERQALARMDHPNIAKVLDAGADELGRPYFVMEYVPGRPITRFCDEHRLGLRDRLELFCQACEAIAHAHTKAIIHRDVKGSNVLAHLQDGRPVVKVIDFGVAKAITGDRLSEDTFSTDRGSMIGTYDSMSPEQADASRDIDTRTDVYSLGVLLYELIAGAKPFDRRTLLERPDHEVRRIIREVEPPRPSTRLPQSSEGLTRVAQLRQMRPDALRRALAGELAWIPLKAMRKERDRRYASPLELADDVRNYLEGRPLVAGPESRAYVVRKFVARNRAAVVGAAAVLVLSVAAASFYVYSIRAEQARTLKALRTAEEQRKIAEDRTEYAEYQSTVANNSKMFLGEMLRALNPTRSKGKVVLAVDVLRETERRVASQYTEQPAVEGQLRNELGDLYLALGEAEDALAQYARVREIRLKLWGTDATLSIVSEGRVGEALEALGRLDEAEANFRAALERCKKYFKADHFEMLRAQTNLGRLLARTGRHEEAEPLLRAAYEQRRSMTGRDVGPDGFDTLRTGGYLGEVLESMGRVREAEALLRDVLARRRQVAGEDDPDVVRFQHRLAELLADSGRADEAEALFRAALVAGRKVFPESHPDVVALLTSFADFLSGRGKLDEAEPLAREAVDRAVKGLPSDDPHARAAKRLLAEIQQSRGATLPPVK